MQISLCLSLAVLVAGEFPYHHVFGYQAFQDDSMSCRDLDNNPVDWFVIYKLPRLAHHPNPVFHDGGGFSYLDARRPTWRLSDKSISDTDQPLAYTFNQVTDAAANENITYASYNDEKPGGSTSMAHGHTKGMLGFGAGQGFWLVHSVPKWPSLVKDGYVFPHTGLRYGQTLLCLTLPAAALNDIGVQLQYTYPRVYDARVSPAVARTSPDFAAAVLHKRHVTQPPWTRTLDLQTVGGQAFTHFAKFGKWGDDLYSDWLMPHYSTTLLVESWRDGAGDMKDVCGHPYQTMNILTLTWRDTAQPLRMKVTEDHSKWTVGNGTKVSCIGGINRQEAQRHRAGGAVCFFIDDVWSSFFNLVTDVEPCNN